MVTKGLGDTDMVPMGYQCGSQGYPSSTKWYPSGRQVVAKWTPSAEAQKPKTFRVVTFHAQKLSG